MHFRRRGLVQFSSLQGQTQGLPGKVQPQFLELLFRRLKAKAHGFVDQLALMPFRKLPLERSDRQAVGVRVSARMLQMFRQLRQLRFAPGAGMTQFFGKPGTDFLLGAHRSSPLPCLRAWLRS